MIRVGIIGLGGMGNMHLGCYASVPGAEVVALADVNEDRLRPGESAQKINIGTGGGLIDPDRQHLYTDADELIADPDVDLVDICLPTFLHAEFTIKALHSGKHVVCEKPMALCHEECLHVLEMAEDAPGRLMIAQVVRFFPAYEYLKEAVDSGRMGRLRHLSMSRMSAPPLWSWQQWLMDAGRSGGAIVDLHVHDADFVQYLLGQPRAVFAGGVRGPSGGWDSITARYIYDDFAASATGSWCMPAGWNFEAAYRAVFDEGCLEYRSTASNDLLLVTENRARAVLLEPKDGYSEELAYFVRCIEGNRAPEKVMPASSAFSIRLVEAERQSIESGRVVEL